MTGPGEYVPDITEGITRVEDLPPPRIERRSRNWPARPCPRCRHRAGRYAVAFFGPEVDPLEIYDNQSDWLTATLIDVGLETTVTDIDAQLPLPTISPPLAGNGQTNESVDSRRN